LTATVAPYSSTVPLIATPTGTVQFRLDGVDLPPVALSTGTWSTSANIPTPSLLSVGTHQFTAVYSGDANFLGGTSTMQAIRVTAN
jgi:hypothetical protein